ncbi:MAG TPA: asparagine synthase (glutamine-hydrolyzing) [Solirubrobacteraceae bacterium]|nr:asparagine synthase (glutamine-hydrolyzing) [Solirubrobacteraceae bacterium]
MCGIAGFAQARAASAEELNVVRRQLALLGHRGPDSQGVIGIGPAALGQTRLAVIDLLTGDPPITNEDGRIGVAFNGEIYNFRGLRQQLIRTGHHLASAGDTEVIAHLAETLSPAELARALDGMFAFAVWDEERRRLVLGRDRFGKKPLYWCKQDETLVFASEIKALWPHPSAPRRLNAEMIGPYLTFGYAPTPHTFYQGVQSLPPGHVLTFEPGCEPRIQRYWQVPLPPVNGSLVRTPTREQATATTRTLVREAVARRLVADVPLGAFLSGGVDSTVVVATMAELSPRPVKTFTVGFDDGEGFDERPYAQMVAKRFGTEHHEFVVKPNAIELIERLVWHHDQPFGDSSAIPTYLLCERTRKDVTVALSGDGGDELFAGYERFVAGSAFASYLLLPLHLRRLAAWAAGRLPPSARTSRIDRLRRLLASGNAELLRTYANWISYFPEPLRTTMGGPSANERALAEYRSAWNKSSGQPVLERLLDLNARTYLVDDLLVKTDRMSMAHGLEVRSPLLDWHLAEYVFRLPGPVKVPWLRRKHLLMEAFAAEIPAVIRRRRKQGFAVPLDRWFREDMSSYAESMLGHTARLREHLHPAGIDQVLAVHRAGRRNYGHGIWALLTLELFLRREGW